MEPTEVGILSGAALSVLIPYLSAFGESVAKAAGQKLGSSLGDVKGLWERVKARFLAKPESASLVAAFEKAPLDAQLQTSVRGELQKFLATDSAFARVVFESLRKASDAGVDGVFNTNMLATSLRPTDER